MNKNTALTIRNFRSKFLTLDFFSIAADECVGLIGPSGSGKSMTLRAIVDLEENQGELAIGSLRRKDCSPEVWRQNVIWVPARPVWWGETLREHFVQDPEQRLRRLGFEDLTLLEASPSRLSSGESQRMGLARSLDRNPKALLLDEPTANLDDDSAKRVESEIRRYQEENKAPILRVGHDLQRLKASCSRIYQLRDELLHPVQ